jgi:hypothetical protein
MRRLCVFLTFTAFWGVAAATVGVPKGENCNLSVPPTDAGEVSLHGTILRVYPKATDITPSYNGCQVLFAPSDDKWVVLSLTEISDGDPVRIWSDFEEGAAIPDCRFKKGRVVQGDPHSCPAAEFLLIKSRPVGCTQRVVNAITKQGLRAALPRECEIR